MVKNPMTISQHISLHVFLPSSQQDLFSLFIRTKRHFFAKPAKNFSRFPFPKSINYSAAMGLVQDIKINARLLGSRRKYNFQFTLKSARYDSTTGYTCSEKYHFLDRKFEISNCIEPIQCRHYMIRVPFIRRDDTFLYHETLVCTQISNP